MTRPLTLVLCAVLLSSCATSPPRHLNNICRIFDEKSGWYKQAKRASKRWGSSIPVMMAIMHQESRFRAKAKPPYTKILWVIPGPRKSDAYGYSQAKNATWDWYKKSSGRRGADRDEFGDAIDFIGWYNSKTYKINKVKRNSTFHLYLAYHEGHGGYKRRTYKKKAWLVRVAKKVSQRAQRYQKQLNRCEKRLNSSGFWFWPF